MSTRSSLFLFSVLSAGVLAGGSLFLEGCGTDQGASQSGSDRMGSAPSGSPSGTPGTSPTGGGASSSPGSGAAAPGTGERIDPGAPATGGAAPGTSAGETPGAGAPGAGMMPAAGSPGEGAPSPGGMETGMPGSRRAGALKFRHQMVRKAAISESGGFGDINNDGNVDVAFGPHWFEGPDFTKMHEIYPAPQEAANPLAGGTGSSRDWFTHVYDFDGDGWKDILRGRGPGDSQSVGWYKNPGKGAVDSPSMNWSLTTLGPGWLEQRPFVDIGGDGKPDILTAQGQRLGFYDSSKGWKTFTVVDPGASIPDATTHGLGHGDIDGDGKMDVIFSRAWYRQTATGWEKHAYNFQPSGLMPPGEPGNKEYMYQGGAEMYGYDVDGDGDTDVVSSLDSHGWGLAWFENKKNGDAIQFTPHLIMGSDKQKGMFGGIAYSQLHSLIVADMDGDGLLDIVSGKCFKAHPKASLDPDVDGTPFIYVWRLTREGGTVKFVPHQVADVIGVGRQFSVGDITGDGVLDIIASTRQGAHVFIQEAK